MRAGLDWSESAATPSVYIQLDSIAAWLVDNDFLQEHSGLMFLPQEILLHEPPDPIDGDIGVAMVPGAARAAGGAADALVEVDMREHQRRVISGIHAVTDLGLLARLLGLPHGEVVRWDDISADDQRRLRSAPDGIVDCSSAGVQRRLAPPVAVPLVLVRSRSWRRGLRTASVFEPFAQRVLVLEDFRQDLSKLAWEADVLGVGVWLKTGQGIREIVPPAPWRQRYVKAAGWRFRERAYSRWLSARPPRAWSAFPAGHQVLQADAVSGPLPISQSLAAG